MWRQRESRWRWPLARKRARPRPPAPGTVVLLDSISLTAHYAVPTPPETTPTAGAGDLLATVSRDGSLEPAGVRTGEQPAVRTDEQPAVRTGEQPAVGFGEHTIVDWGRRLSLRKIAVAVGGLALVMGGLAAGLTVATSATTPPPAHVRVAESPVSDRFLLRPDHFHLARASSVPAPAPPRVALSPPTSAHEVFGYAPYWTLPQASHFPVDDFSTIAYFGLDVNPNGTIEKSGPGWDGYQSQDFTNLVNAAHQAGDRVVLTATDFSESSLYLLAHEPNIGETLGKQLTELVKTENLDGVNLDFEGTGDQDQAGLDYLVSQVDFILHATDPHYQLTVSTYASSAGDPNGFYDIAGLRKWVNAFFVMAYDVNQGPSQGDGNAGGADASYIAQYTSAAGASKVILGLPLFGYDEPTTGPDLGDPATGPSQPVTDAQAMSSGPTYWDAATQTAWTSYQTGGQWHQVFFDNANTVAGMVLMAAGSHLLGLGAWALGMEGDNDSVLSVLSGGAAPQSTPPAGPATSQASSQETGSPGPATGGGGASGGGGGGGGGGQAPAATTPAAQTGSAHNSPRTTTTTRPKRSKGTTTTSESTPSTEPQQSTTTSSTTGGTGNSGASSTTTTEPLP
jgi:hypothetical protein